MTGDDFNDIAGNLIENAIRAANSRIRIAVSRGSASEVRRFMVEDDGPGVPAEKIDAILQRGQRLDEKSGGAGLGLAIVSDILEEYDTALEAGASPLGGLKIGFPLPADAGTQSLSVHHSLTMTK